MVDSLAASPRMSPRKETLLSQAPGFQPRTDTSKSYEVHHAQGVQHLQNDSTHLAALRVPGTPRSQQALQLPQERPASKPSSRAGLLLRKHPSTMRPTPTWNVPSAARSSLEHGHAYCFQWCSPSHTGSTGELGSLQSCFYVIRIMPTFSLCE